MMAADDFQALMETLALLRDQPGMERLAEAERAIAAGDLTTRDEMAAIMAERERREAG
jgi:PHD/YefM family antitoxin component YafN of YafNO toxin-antitoxin module